MNESELRCIARHLRDYYKMRAANAGQEKAADGPCKSCEFPKNIEKAPCSVSRCRGPVLDAAPTHVFRKLAKLTGIQIVDPCALNAVLVLSSPISED